MKISVLFFSLMFFSVPTFSVIPDAAAGEACPTIASQLNPGRMARVKNWFFGTKLRTTMTIFGILALGASIAPEPTDEGYRVPIFTGIHYLRAWGNRFDGNRDQMSVIRKANRIYRTNPRNRSPREELSTLVEGIDSNYATFPQGVSFSTNPKPPVHLGSQNRE